MTRRQHDRLCPCDLAARAWGGRSHQQRPLAPARSRSVAGVL